MNDTDNRKLFREAMAHLSAAVNIITTDGPQRTLRYHGKRGVFRDRQPAHHARLREPVERYARGVRGQVAMSVSTCCPAITRNSRVILPA